MGDFVKDVDGLTDSTGTTPIPDDPPGEPLIPTPPTRKLSERWRIKPGWAFQALMVWERFNGRRWELRTNRIVQNRRTVAAVVYGTKGWPTEHTIQLTLLLAAKALGRVRKGLSSEELHEVDLTVGWKAKARNKVTPVAAVQWNRWTATKLQIAAEERRTKKADATEDRITVLIAPDVWPGVAAKCDQVMGGCGREFHFGPLKMRAFGQNQSWFTKCPHCKKLHTCLVTNPPIRKLQAAARLQWLGEGQIDQAALRTLVGAVDRLMGRGKGQDPRPSPKTA